MGDPSRTNPGLIQEISALKQKIKELEQSESERKRVSQALRESEEYFKAVIQNSSDIIFVLDKLGTITYASPSVEHVLGYGPDELIGKRLLDLIVPDDKSRAIEEFGKALLVKEVLIPNDFRIKHKNGTERVFEGFGNNLFDNPTVAGFVMNIRDITDRKGAEDKLHKSEERYRALVENASDIIYRVDATGHVIFANPSGLRVTGYKEEELIGKNYSTLIRQDMRDEAMKFFGRQFVGGIKNTYSEYPILTKKGNEVWLGQNTQLIVEEGQVIGFQAMSRDITDRKRMEEALRESESKYRQLIDGMNETVWVIDFNGNLIDVNNTAVESLGYSKKELLAIGLYGIDSSLQRDDIKALANSMSSDKTQIFETSHTTKDGRTFPVEVYSSLVTYQGKQAILSIARNITDRKRMEEALKESERRYRELSFVDELTQLFNSRYFYVQLKSEIGRSNRYEQPLTLLLLDLDDFKKFNDAYGHVEGDQVLSRLGQVMKRCLRETDSAYRYGGEEFTIILPMTTNKEGSVIAERIRTEFKEETFSPARGKDIHVTVSIGLAQYKTQENMKSFVHRADQLMYQGKKNGKDRVCWDS